MLYPFNYGGNFLPAERLNISSVAASVFVSLIHRIHYFLLYQLFSLKSRKICRRLNFFTVSVLTHRQSEKIQKQRRAVWEKGTDKEKQEKNMKFNGKGKKRQRNSKKKKPQTSRCRSYCGCPAADCCTVQYLFGQSPERQRIFSSQ